MEYLYRYYSYSTNGEMRFIMDKFEITKRTKCGVWIDNYGAKKFVNQNARNNGLAYQKKKLGSHLYLENVGKYSYCLLNYIMLSGP